MPGSDQRRDWEDLSALDPYWAILSDPSRRFGRWDIEAFLASGIEAIDAVLAEGARFGLPRQHRSALDFGCGVGRLAQALARDFDECLGLDVSERMIEEARALAKGVANCRFAVLGASDLASLDTGRFDLVVSHLVLQHVSSAESKLRYIAHLTRVLHSGGLLALQLPSRIPARHRLQPRPRMYSLLRRAGVSYRTLYLHLRLHPVRMTALSQSQVARAIGAAGGRMLDIREERTAGGVISSEYLATKEG